MGSGTSRSHYTVPNLPEPDRARCEHTRLRRRVLYSVFREDLISRLTKAIGHVRRQMWGEPDMTANPYLALWSQLAVLYHRSPELGGPDGVDELATAIQDAGYWGLMGRVQRDVLALREVLIRVEVSDAGELSFRVVFPDMATAEAEPKAPSTPVRIRELVWTADYGWVWYDLETRSSRGGPYYRAITVEGALDVSVAVLGGRYEGETYPYIDDMGLPFLPYVVYHAAETACLWDPYAYREVVEGALNIGVLLTFYQHCVRNSAWSQRYVVGAQPAGADVSDGDEEDGSTVLAPPTSRSEVQTDPASLLVLEPTETDGTTQVQPIIGQWSSPVNPDDVLRSILVYERRLLIMAGLQPPDVTKQEADVRSGYSLAVAREAVREQQAAYEEQFRRGDLQVLRIVALLLNAVTDSSHPTEGFRISYKALPKSPAELKADREELLALVDAGFLDRVTAYQRLNPGLDRTEAEAALAEIALQNAPGEVGQQPLAGAQLSALLQVLAAVGGGQLTPDAGAGLVLLVVPTLEPQKARDLAAGARSTAPTPSPAPMA